MADSNSRHSRRDVLRLAGAATAGAVASTLASALPAAAANGDPLTAGGSFEESSPLVISNTTATGSTQGGIVAKSAGDGVGVIATSDSGTALLAWVGPSAPPPGTSGGTAGGVFTVNLDVEASGVYASVDRGKGMWATAGGPGGIALYGQTFGGEGSVGVAGIVDDGIPDGIVDVGVFGLGPAARNGIGVYGLVEAAAGTGLIGVGGWGVYGFGGVGVVGDAEAGATGLYGHVGATAPATPPPSVAVYASAPSTAHTALRVNGKAVFSRSGKSTIATGHSSVTKTLAGVTTSSLVIATVQTARSGFYLLGATPGTGSFTIRMNKAVTASTVVAWMILN